MKSILISKCYRIVGFGVVGLALVLTCGASTCIALKPGEVSLAAEVYAGYCAIGAMHPDQKVRNPDYLARDLLPTNFWVLGPLLPDFKRARALVQAFRVTRYFSANAVSRHIDGILTNMGANGVKQVVNIGAGFDSRAYRFAKQMKDVHFFELDQPATLDAKKERVKAVVGGLPSSVTYIPIDYRSQTVFDALKQAGYQDDLKTLFIWEASSRFADRHVADQTLRSIPKHAAAGSEVVLDYVVDAVVQGDYSKYRGARYRAIRASVNGEPWKFGIPEDQAKTYVSQCGLEVISDLGPNELTEKYLMRSDGKPDGKPAPWWRVIHARVGR